jgi:catechol-2,3-dioxygenase
MINGLNHYNLRAPRPLLEALRDFYRDVIGLEVGQRPPFRQHGYWLWAGGAPILHLSEAEPGEERSAHAVNTFDHAAFSCADRAGIERRLRQLGVAYETSRVPQTGQVQLFLTDPAGNGVELNFANADA